LISMVLTSIYLAAALVAVGTPLAAILVWRNKHKLLPKPSANEARQEAALSAVGSRAEKQLRR